MQSGSQYEGSLSGLLDYNGLHGDLRSRIRKLHPGSDSGTAVESVRQEPGNTLEEILKEVQEIRKNMEKE